jgi:hypothetical protein
MNSSVNLNLLVVVGHREFTLRHHPRDVQIFIWRRIGAAVVQSQNFLVSRGPKFREQITPGR